MIRVLNEQDTAWPQDTRLVLAHSDTDLRLAESIQIGPLPPKSQANIKLNIDASNSDLCWHVFSYQLIYNREPIVQIG